MAEFLAAVGIIANFGQLIQLSCQVVSLLSECNAQSAYLPESLSRLEGDLALLTDNLKKIEERVAYSPIPQDIQEHLEKTAERLLVDVSFILKYVGSTKIKAVTPFYHPARIRAVWRVLRAGNKIEQASVNIQRTVPLLILHQTNLAVETGDITNQKATRIEQNLDKIAIQIGHGASLKQRNFGLCLGLTHAPEIPQDAFVGRDSELRILRDWLSPSSNNSKEPVSIVGMGGLGKTQLSLAFAKRHETEFSSIFWINAQTLTSLRQGVVAIHKFIFSDHTVTAVSKDDEDRRIAEWRAWLSEPWNTRWLLILDNYDDSDLPHICSSTGYDIRQIFPQRTQGNILITTRSSELAFSRCLHLQKLIDIEVCVAVLSQRSARDLKTDENARKLAQRLDGLPFALATAGAYLKQNTLSCAEYLKLYETRWPELHSDEARNLMECGGRTLGSTWIISYEQVSGRDPEASELFRFLAYLDNQDIWYDLVRAGVEDGPDWLKIVAADKLRYDKAMSRLHSYGLIEVVHGAYHRMHPCLHDWISNYFHRKPSDDAFLTALNCVAKLIPGQDNPNSWEENRRLLPHVLRLKQSLFSVLWDNQALNEVVLDARLACGHVLSELGRLDMAEIELTQALFWRKQASGELHSSVPKIMLEIGRLYQRQGRFEEARALLDVTIATYRDQPGVDQVAVDSMALERGLVVRDMDMPRHAETIFEQAVSDFEAKLGSQHVLTLSARFYLGQLYNQTDRFSEAEDMLQAAALGFNKTLSSKHPLALQATLHLSFIRAQILPLDKAEAACLYVLNQCLNSFGIDHTTTLTILGGLGWLYHESRKDEEAEDMLLKALSGYQHVLGENNLQTLITLRKLGTVYACQETKSSKAEGLLSRSLSGLEQKLGKTHAWTMDAVESLALLYTRRNKLDQAEDMFERIMSTCDSMGAIKRAQALTPHFANVLYSSLVSQHKNSCAMRQRLVRLINLVDEWEEALTKLSSDPLVLYWLGRAFIHVSEQDNARTAFSHYLKRAHDELSVYDDWSCRACGNRFPLIADCYVCLICEEVLICSKCMTSWPHGDVIAQTCSRHDRHDQSAAEVWEAGSPEAAPVPDLFEWLGNLKHRFSSMAKAEV